MKILGTGLTGLIGSRIVELLSPEYFFHNVSRSTGLDITDFESVKKEIQDSDQSVVLHFAAYTDVKKAELEKGMGEQSEAWRINVKGTENVVQACEASGKKLIYMSTDLIFNGENAPPAGYSEDDNANPLNWYARTKYEGELRVRAMKNPWIVMRPAYPYRANYEKNDFVRLFMQKLSNKEELTVITDRIITPTFIDNIALAMRKLIECNSTGIYHVVGSSKLSIYDAAIEIAKFFEYDKNLIHKTTRKEFLVGRPDEPFNSALSNAKIRELGVSMLTFLEGLSTIKEQLAADSKL